MSAESLHRLVAKWRESASHLDISGWHEAARMVRCCADDLAKGIATGTGYAFDYGSGVFRELVTIADADKSKVPTPGPWLLRSMRGFYNCGVFADGHGCIAAINTKWARPQERAEQEANARLIAAAPDLLALLTELIDIEGPQPGHIEWARKVQAAIAKATTPTPDDRGATA